jgi:hypothetical protein
MTCHRPNVHQMLYQMGLGTQLIRVMRVHKWNQTMHSCLYEQLSIYLLA